MTSTLRTYASPEAMKQLRGGLLSIESDYGYKNWDDLRLPGFPTQQDQTAGLQVTHIISTGDFYATPSTQETPVALLGRVRHHEGAILDDREVHHLLWDWAETGISRPLSWFIERITRINQAPQGARDGRPLAFPWEYYSFLQDKGM